MRSPPLTDFPIALVACVVFVCNAGASNTDGSAGGGGATALIIGSVGLDHGGVRGNAGLLWGNGGNGGAVGGAGGLGGSAAATWSGSSAFNGLNGQNM